MDEWPKHKCIQLIRAYRTKPLLWDPKNPFYFKKTIKPEMWEDIAASVNSTPEACKNKMIVLLSSFRREKAKVVKSLKQTSDVNKVYRSTWFAFKEMSFLMDKNTERKRLLDINTNDTEVDTDGDEPINRSGTSTQAVDQSAKKKMLLKQGILKLVTESPYVSKKRKLVELSQQTIVGSCHSNTTESTYKDRKVPEVESQLTPGTSICTINSDFNEEIKSFTNFIGYKMKRYSETTKNAVQEAICEIIFKADHNQYERIGIDFNNQAIEENGYEENEGDPMEADGNENSLVKIESDSD